MEYRKYNEQYMKSQSNYFSFKKELDRKAYET
jgi:hypothetical protein